jgi:hypothetical protein
MILADADVATHDACAHKGEKKKMERIRRVRLRWRTWSVRYYSISFAVGFVANRLGTFPLSLLPEVIYRKQMTYTHAYRYTIRVCTVRIGLDALRKCVYTFSFSYCVRCTRKTVKNEIVSYSTYANTCAYVYTFIV